MDSTTNITELPKLSDDLSNISLQNSQIHDNQLHESQIQQLVTGIQDASFKGATRLRTADIPADPSTVIIDPEIIPKPININPQPVIQDTVPVQITLVEHIKNFVYDSRIPLLVGILASISQIPMITDYIKKSFPWMYSDNGNITLIGLLVYIITTGAIYYILTVTVLAK